MNQGTGEPGGSRDEIVAILLLAAAAGGLGYFAGRAVAENSRNQTAIPAHAVVAPTSLKDIAAQAGLQPPTALAHIRRLQDQGKLQRVATPDGPRYAVLPFVRCEWIDPDHGINTAWQSSRPIDWRFPLVSRVPDQRGQDFLNEWLDRAQARGLLPTSRSRFEKQDKLHSLQVIAYGSCARGDAGPNSDLDLLLHGDMPKRGLEALKDLAHEVALKTGRPPDIRLMDTTTWQSASAAFKESIRRDGKTVWSNDYDALFLERAVVTPA